MEYENEGGSLYFSPKFLVDRGDEGGSLYLNPNFYKVPCFSFFFEWNKRMKVDLCILVQNFWWTGG